MPLLPYHSLFHFYLLDFLYHLSGGEIIFTRLPYKIKGVNGEASPLEKDPKLKSLQQALVAVDGTLLSWSIMFKLLPPNLPRQRNCCLGVHLQNFFFPPFSVG